MTGLLEEIFPLNIGCPNIEIKGEYSDSCTISLSRSSMDAVLSGVLRLRVQQIGKKQRLDGIKVQVGASSGVFALSFGDSGSTLSLGENCSGHYNIVNWRSGNVRVGANTTANGIRMICDNSTIEIGDDCMFSDEVLIQSSDQHGIVDLASGKIINASETSVLLGSHVWVGRRVCIMPNSEIGEGTVIGAGAIVTGNIPATSIAVGAPARVIRSNVTWSRSPDYLDKSAQLLFQSFKNSV